MSFETAIAAAFDAAWTAIADTGTYRAEWGTVTGIRILNRPDVDRDFVASETIRTDQTVLEMITADCLGINSVKRGEIIEFNDREYHIDRVESDDGIVTRVVCSDRTG